MSGSRTADSQYVRECLRLSGQLFALGEAAYFFSHRLLSERHGPYEIDDQVAVSCRHAVNLDTSRVWPEVPLMDELPKQVCVWTFYGTSVARTFRYDMFANPIFYIDPVMDCIGAAAFSMRREFGDEILLDKAGVSDLRSKLSLLTEHIIGIVGTASERRLAEAMRSIMWEVCDHILGSPLGHISRSEQIRGPFDFRVEGSFAKLVDYYDWRQG
jgi:hypothetical protein